MLTFNRKLRLGIPIIALRSFPKIPLPSHPSSPRLSPLPALLPRRRALLSTLCRIPHIKRRLIASLISMLLPTTLPLRFSWICVGRSLQRNTRRWSFQYAWIWRKRTMISMMLRCSAIRPHLLEYCQLSLITRLKTSKYIYNSSSPPPLTNYSAF